MIKKSFLALPRRYKQSVAILTDCLLIPIIFVIALVLHLENFSAATMHEFSAIALITPLLCVPVFIRNGLYRAIIRYIDYRIVSTIIYGATVSTAALCALTWVMARDVFSPNLFVIFWAIFVLYLLTSRFLARGFFLNERRAGGSSKAVAIYGAGEAGSKLAFALRRGNEYRPVLFVDDNPQLHGITIAGIKVYPVERLAPLMKRYSVATVLIAIPSLSHAGQRDIINRLTPLKLRIKVTPPIDSLVRGMLRVQDVREIEIEDLLSRDPVAPDLSLLSACIAGKTVLVSGAGGSIGSELCRQIISLRPSRLVMLEISEFALYAVEHELSALVKAQAVDCELVALLGSVTDFERCTGIMTTFGVHTVYHAAAYKHVPMVEQNPVEGLRNNTFGTLSIARAAVAARVANFVLVSTDKAVRPTNVMGASKRLAELVLQGLSRQHPRTRFSMVRFGNVLGSSGSVVPLFKRQIAAGGPVTLTHPEITRYFMTIPEAAQLVLQAGSMASGGDVFVLDVGEPVKIADLARRMIELSGRQVGSALAVAGSIEIKYVGLRPGEKLYEELLIGDNVSGTAHPRIMRAQEAEIAWPFLERMLEQLRDTCDRGDHDAIRAQLIKIVREYTPSSELVDPLWLNRATGTNAPFNPPATRGLQAEPAAKT